MGHRARPYVKTTSKKTQRKGIKLTNCNIQRKLQETTYSLSFFLCPLLVTDQVDQVSMHAKHVLCHIKLLFYLCFETGPHYVAQAGIKLLGSSNSLV
jgi:hypothetical protein